MTPFLFRLGTSSTRTACAALLLGISSMASANDWSRFQGPVSSSADVNRLPMKWAPQENILWKAEITGYGQSSPVTWGDTVFITSISGPKKEQSHVAAFDLKSGKKLWQHDLASASQYENNNYVSKAAPTPVVDAAGLYCFFEGGNVLSLTHDGKVRWQRNLVEELGAIESRHGISASLEQTDDRIFVWVERSKDPYVLAVDKTSGKDIWKSEGLSTTSWASPRLVPVKGGQHLVLSGIGVLAGLDPATGKQLWKFDGIKGNSTPTPVPVSEGRFLIGATAGRGEGDSGKAAESNGLIGIQSKDDGTFDVQFIWKAKRATSSFGSPAAHQGHAYYVNAAGVLYCLDLETGEERFSNRLAESIWATPMPLGDRICFFGKGGTVSIVAAGPKFEKLAENATWEVTPPPESKEPAQGGGGGQGGGAQGGAGGRGGPGAGGFGGPVLYAAVYAKDHLLLRRGDSLYCVVNKAQ